jgi:hypothetical protein
LEIALHVCAAEVLAEVWDFCRELQELSIFTKFMGEKS